MTQSVRYRLPVSDSLRWGVTYLVFFLQGGSESKAEFAIFEVLNLFQQYCIPFYINSGLLVESNTFFHSSLLEPHSWSGLDGKKKN
jgi:hypothetical protein